jgi:DNA replication protein DnaC
MQCPECVASAHKTRETWRAQCDLYARWLRSGIPRRYRNRTFTNFDAADGTRTAFELARRYVDLFEHQSAHGTGLLFIGGVGTGKTHLAIAAMTEIILAGHDGAFIAVPDLFAAKRPGYSGDRDTSRLADVDVLVLDDVGANRGTEWEVGVLSDLINGRYDAQLPTIVTTNTSLPDLAVFVGSRAADRFCESMITARLAGLSYRSRAADDDVLRDAPLAIPEPPRDFEASICCSGKMLKKAYRRTDNGEEKIK